MIHGYFYPRPPRGGRPLRWLFPCQMLQFLSTPSARRATLHGVRQSGGIQFLSTPSARRATKVLREGVPSGQISIHALREEGDSSRWSSLSYPQDFYPRPPRGGRPRSGRSSSATRRFLSTPSARRATCFRLPVQSVTRFLSTPSARRATAKTETKSLFSNKLYNILHEFRRALIYNGSKNYPNHAK